LTIDTLARNGNAETKSNNLKSVISTWLSLIDKLRSGNETISNFTKVLILLSDYYTWKL